MSNPTNNNNALQPSKVLHVSNLPPNTVNEDLMAFLSSFGKVEFVCLLSKHAQALIEMDSIESATAALQYSATTPVFLKNRQVYFNYSRSPQINRNTGSRSGANAPPSSKVLLLTILNPVYNITCDVLHQIMTPYGNVLRIVIFMKNGVQAMVEFDTETSAANALQALDGRDIYAGTCTLKIVLSRAETLNVKQNDERNRDYTNPNLPSSLIPAYSMPPQQMGMGNMNMGGPMHPPMGGHMQMDGSGAPAVARTVVLVHGLRADLSCQQIFNLFCLFGNIVRIKHLPHKPEIGMVQYADPAAADACIRLLNGTPLFDQLLDIRYSKHAALVSGRADGEAGGDSFQDFSQSPLNRFRRHSVTSSKHVCVPGSTLYFSNVPSDFTAENLSTFMQEKCGAAPLDILFFQVSHATRSGLLDMGSIANSINAIVHANHSVVGHNTIKFSFTTNRIKPSPPQ